MATWPTTIPITRENYTEEPADRVVRSNMDVGPQKVRRRSSVAIRPVSLKLFLTDAQLTTFDTFFLANDSLVFDFTNPRTSAAERARFTSRPSYNLNEKMWDVQVKIELLP